MQTWRQAQEQFKHTAMIAAATEADTIKDKDEKTTAGGKRDGAGRKPLPEAERRKPRTLYLTDREWFEVQEFANKKRAGGVSNAGRE